MPKIKTSKQDILEKATELFHRNGYHKTSMMDIAEACGILKGSLYHHFKNKEELMKEVLVNWGDKFKEGAFNQVLNEDISVIEKLNLLIDYSEKMYLDSKGSFLAGLFLETINVVPDFTKMIKAFFTEWIDTVTELLTEIYPKEGALKIAKESIAAIEGSVMMMQLFNDKTFLTRTHESLRRKVAADLYKMQKIA